MHVIHHAMLVAGGVGVRHIARGAGKPATPMLHDVQAVGMVGHHMRQFAVQLAARHVVMICAPCSSAANATEARVVSMDSTAFGNQRVHSAQHTGLLVGFADAFGSRTGGFRSDVDDVGTGFIIASPWALAASGASQRPPSEKESSVMLSTPITNVRWLS